MAKTIQQVMRRGQMKLVSGGKTCVACKYNHVGSYHGKPVAQSRLSQVVELFRAKALSRAVTATIDLVDCSNPTNSRTTSPLESDGMKNNRF